MAPLFLIREIYTVYYEEKKKVQIVDTVRI